jgi:hypothetical protein
MYARTNLSAVISMLLPFRFLVNDTPNLYFVKYLHKFIC